MRRRFPVPNFNSKQLGRRCRGHLAFKAFNPADGSAALPARPPFWAASFFRGLAIGRRFGQILSIGIRVRLGFGLQG